MCSRPAWPLKIITRRTPLRTKSARISRTKALSASTDTLTVPGYGRVVVQTPYGIGGATYDRVGRASSFVGQGGLCANAPWQGGARGFARRSHRTYRGRSFFLGHRR